jgi:DNA polymerase V
MSPHTPPISLPHSRPRTLIALLDCNNFYASCERLVDPSLRTRPVAVLSSNDGCIIARSEEVKALGVEMGAPVFKIRDVLERNGVVLRSANFALYRDVSALLIKFLRSEFPVVEVYSVDETFLDLTGLERYLDLPARLLATRTRIDEELGIPVSIGVAPTKVLAKVANKLAKKTKTNYVQWLTDPAEIEHYLRLLPIEDVWGIGHRTAHKLRARGVTTAWQFAQLSEAQVLKDYTRPQLQVLQELKSKPAIGLEVEEKEKKMMGVTRQFGALITDLADLESAVAHFTWQVYRKLHFQRLAAQVVQVYLNTNRHRPDLPQYRAAHHARLPLPSADPAELLHHAFEVLRHIYRPGYHYHRAGVSLSEICRIEEVQYGLFDNTHRHALRHELVKVMTKFNKAQGRPVLNWAVFEKFPTHSAKWRPRSAHKSSAHLPQLLHLTDEDRAISRQWKAFAVEPFEDPAG